MSIREICLFRGALRRFEHLPYAQLKNSSGYVTVAQCLVLPAIDENGPRSDDAKLTVP
jgi:hypothetical protein